MIRDEFDNEEMTLPKNIRKYIEAGRWDDLEEAWLAHLAEGVADPGFFAQAARQLKGVGEEERATWLLELVCEEWREQGAWEERLSLTREAAELLAPPSDQHRIVVECLRALYPDSASFDGLAEFVGLYRAIEDIPKIWDKVDLLRALLSFETDSIVWMKDKGAGPVVEVNFELESFKVDFERNPGLRVGFRAAPKLLTPLPEGHVLRTKLESPEELRRLNEKSPSELLLAVLESWDEPMAAAEIRDAVSGIVAADQWTSWWLAARKSDRILTEGTGARQRYHAAASGAAADRSIAAAFDTADLRGRIALFQRHSDRDPELAGSMAERLRASASRATDAETAFALWYALQDGGHPASPDEAWAPSRLIADADDPAELLSGIADRLLRERGYRLVQELHPDAAEVLSGALAVETEPRLLDLLAALLEGTDALERFTDALLAQPRRYPAALVWLAEGAGARSDLVTRSPLRLLQHVLGALVQDEFKSYKPRLRKALEGNDLLPRLIQSVGPEQADATEKALVRGHLEEYVRTPLINALHLRFPDMREETTSALYALVTSIEERRRELTRLKEKEIPANRKAIQEARELGDLRENFEYKSARQRHEYLSSRVASLDGDLARARPIDLSRDDAAEVRIASTVRFAEDGDERALTILGPWESDPDSGVISYDSDLGRALLGGRAGDEVEFGARRLSILAIEPYREG